MQLQLKDDQHNLCYPYLNNRYLIYLQFNYIRASNTCQNTIKLNVLKIIFDFVQIWYDTYNKDKVYPYMVTGIPGIPCIG